jgi:hypothetical protein
MKIIDGGLDDSRVQALLTHHFTTARAETGRGSAHALDLGGLKSPDIHFYSALLRMGRRFRYRHRRFETAHGIPRRDKIHAHGPIAQAERRRQRDRTSHYRPGTRTGFFPVKP